MDTPNKENLSFDKTLPQDTTLPNAMSITQLDISLIVADSDQPRKVFNQNALDELASSIKNYGVLQPVIVTKCGSKYKLVAGERRYRASLSAGLATIPAIVKEFSATEKQEVALIENLQRENLNPIEEARAYKALMEDFDFTQEELATRLGKSRPVIANSLRLLTLPLAVRDMVTAGRLSQGHARCLVAIKDANVQTSYALGACDKQLSVRQLEKMVYNYSHKSKPKKVITPTASPELRDLVNHMQDLFGTKIKAMGNNHKGRILIDYYSQVDLERIFAIVSRLRRK